MSGFEVAGLILAVFPLMISGMEHYEGVEKKTRTWWRIKRVHRRDCISLEFAKIEYEAVINKLLDPLLLEGVIDEGKCRELLTDPECKSWNDHEIAIGLGERLGLKTATFLETMYELERLISELAEATKATDPHFQAALMENKVIPSRTKHQSCSRSGSRLLIRRSRDECCDIIC